MMSLSAFVMIATIAESLSLSPNLSSSVATISFSLITGIMSWLSSSLRASVVFINCDLSSNTFLDIKTCATFKLLSLKIFLNEFINSI